MVEFATPQFTKEHPTTENLWRDCPREVEVRLIAEKNKPNAYEAIYVKELKKLMEESKIVGLFHLNSITNRNYRKVRRVKLIFSKQQHFYNLYLGLAREQTPGYGAETL